MLYLFYLLVLSTYTGHSAIFDNSTKNIYYYGGWGPSATNDNNMYVLNTNNWTWSSVSVTGYPPTSTSTSNGSPSATGSLSGNNAINTTPIIAGSVVGGVALIA